MAGAAGRRQIDSENVQPRSACPLTAHGATDDDGGTGKRGSDEECAMSKDTELRRISIECAQEQLKDRRFEAELRRIEREASIANARERAKLPMTNRHLYTIIGVADITKLPRPNRHLCTVIGVADFIARDSKALEDGDPGDAGFVKLLSFTYARGLADLLLLMAYTNPEKLRERQKFHERSEEHTSELQSHLNLVCRL